MEKTEPVKCYCGGILTVDDIDVTRGTNEEGEEYTRIDVTCPHCKKEFEVWEWGHEFEEEALQSVDYRING